jgi:hypothetical protein
MVWKVVVGMDWVWILGTAAPKMTPYIYRSQKRSRHYFPTRNDRVRIYSSLRIRNDPIGVLIGSIPVCEKYDDHGWSPRVYRLLIGAFSVHVSSLVGVCINCNVRDDQLPRTLWTNVRKENRFKNPILELPASF